MATNVDRKVDSRAMREVNRSIILDLIRGMPQVSRTELAKRSSLTKPTVSAIVEELIAEGIVQEVGFSKSEPTGGRRARLLEFDPDSAAYVGVSLGVTATRVSVADGLGRVRHRLSGPSAKRPPSEALGEADRLIQKALAEVGVPRERVQAVGLAVGGLVETDSGRVVLSPNLGWESVPLRDIATRVLAVPVEVANVTDTAALAEGRSGAARAVRDFVWVYVGTGIGAGIVSQGQLFRGRAGFAGEIGFCRMALDGPILEEVASGRAIVRGFTLATRQQLALDEILRLADAGDDSALRVVREAGAALGLAVAHLVNIMNPELVVLGGSVVVGSSVFAEAARHATGEQVLGPERVPVVTTELSHHAVTDGAVLLAMGRAVQSVRIVAT